MDRNTTIVNLYILQKASSDELELFERSIIQRKKELGIHTAPMQKEAMEKALDADFNIMILIEEQRKLEAVKRVKELTGWGLKESKDYVDDRYDKMIKRKALIKNMQSVAQPINGTRANTLEEIERISRIEQKYMEKEILEYTKLQGLSVGNI